MGHHTFDASRADKLERPEQRYRFLSAEELIWALDLSPDDTVADIGSGTGFYTDDVAPHAGTIYAVDVQEEMHDYYREKGLPENVEPLTTGVSDLPLDSNTVDAVFSTMTYHEFVSDDALAEVHGILARAGRLVIVDWAATGTGDHGPPLDERFTAEEATAALRDTGFRIDHEAVRPETFLLIATAE